MPPGDKEKTDDVESCTLGSTSVASTIMKPYHIFQFGLATMFPYHESTGMSVCLGSFCTGDGDSGCSMLSISRTSFLSSLASKSKASIPSSNTMVSSKTEESFEYNLIQWKGVRCVSEEENDLDDQLRSLHTRQLLDDLQIRELYQERQHVPGTKDYQRKLDCLNKELDLLRNKVDCASTRSGADKQELGKICRRIGQIFKTQERIPEATDAFGKYVNFQRESHGPFHRKVLLALVELGDLLSFGGKYERALESYREAMSVHLRLVGKEKVTEAAILHRIGCVHHSQNQNDQALAFLQLSLNIQRTCKSPQFADTAEKIGIIQLQENNPRQALSLLQSALDVRRQLKDRLLVASTLKYMFSAHIRVNRLEVAQGYFEEWLVVVGDLYGGVGRSIDAVRLYCEALTIGMTIFDTTALQGCNGFALLQTAQLQLQHGDTEHALTLLTHFLQSRQERDDHQADAYLYALIMSGNCLYAEGKRCQAKEYFYKAMHVMGEYDKEYDKGLVWFCNGEMLPRDVLFRLLQEVNQTRLAKMAERVKWMARGIKMTNRWNERGLS